MSLRQITGYIALLILLGIWLYLISRAGPQLRRGVRPVLVVRLVFLVRTTAVVVAALTVGEIHFWAETWWEVVAVAVTSMAAMLALRHAHRRLLAPPKGALKMIHPGHILQ